MLSSGSSKSNYLLWDATTARPSGRSVLMRKRQGLDSTEDAATLDILRMIHPAYIPFVWIELTHHSFGHCDCPRTTADKATTTNCHDPTEWTVLFTVHLPQTRRSAVVRRSPVPQLQCDFISGLENVAESLRICTWLLLYKLRIMLKFQQILLVCAVLVGCIQFGKNPVLINASESGAMNKPGSAWN